MLIDLLAGIMGVTTGSMAVIGGVSQAGAGVFQPVRAGRTGGLASLAATESQSVAAQGADAQNSQTQKTTAGATTGGQTLTPEQQQVVAELRQRDAEVRQHEAAHQAAGGAAAGGASFEYQRGPDGKNYAVGGEVQVDVSGGSTPESTISKMEQVKAAALAPAEPSSQDQRVAAMADAIKMQAQQEARQQKGKEDGSAGQDPAAAESSASGASESGSGESASGEPAADATGGGFSAVNRRAAGAYAAAAAIGGGGGGGGITAGFAVSA